MAKNSLGELENAPGAAHRERAAGKRDLLAARLTAAAQHKKAAAAFEDAAEAEDAQTDICAAKIQKYMSIPVAWRDAVRKSGDFNLTDTREVMRVHQAQSAQHYRSMDESRELAREFNSLKTNLGLRLEILGHDVTAKVQTALGFFGIR